MSTVIHGVVHGNTIELKEALGMPDGQEIEIEVRVRAKTSTPGEGFRRTEGALADDPYWDGIMAQIQRERKLERRPQAEDV